MEFGFNLVEDLVKGGSGFWSGQLLSHSLMPHRRQGFHLLEAPQRKHAQRLLHPKLRKHFSILGLLRFGRSISTIPEHLIDVSRTHDRPYQPQENRGHRQKPGESTTP